MTYSVQIVRLRDWLERLDPLFRQHYAEMNERMHGLGVHCSDYNPRVDKYVEIGLGGVADVVDAVDEAHCTMHDACSFRKHFHCNDWLNPRNDSLLCKCQTSEHDRN